MEKMWKKLYVKKNNLWSSLHPNTIIIDMSTISPKTTIQLHNKLKEKNLGYLIVQYQVVKLERKKGS